MLGLNIVDIIIISALFFYVVIIIKEGLIVLIGRLVAFIGAIVLAFLTYRYVSLFFIERVPLSLGILDAASFLLIFVIVQLILASIFDWLTAFLPTAFNYSKPARILAVIPALFDGLILVTVILLLFAVTPT